MYIFTRYIHILSIRHIYICEICIQHIYRYVYECLFYMKSPKCLPFCSSRAAALARQKTYHFYKIYISYITYISYTYKINTFLILSSSGARASENTTWCTTPDAILSTALLAKSAARSSQTSVPYYIYARIDLGSVDSVPIRKQYSEYNMYILCIYIGRNRARERYIIQYKYSTYIYKNSERER